MDLDLGFSGSGVIKMNITLSFRVWDNKNNRYLNLLGQAITNMGELLLSEDPSSRQYINANIDDYLIEYCTGYKDVDGKYLYVNDYVEFKLGLKMVQAKIVYEHFGFWLYEIRGGMMPFYKYNYKVTGNSHNE